MRTLCVINFVAPKKKVPFKNVILLLCMHIIFLVFGITFRGAMSHPNQLNVDGYVKLKHIHFSLCGDSRAQSKVRYLEIIFLLYI